MTSGQRLLALGALVLAMAVAFGGSPPRPLVHDPLVRLEPLAVSAKGLTLDRRLSLYGMWVLHGRDSYFGGYSALLVQPDGRILAVSDQNLRGLTFAPPVAGQPGTGTLAALPITNQTYRRGGGDFEAAARDAGHYWIVSESNNKLIRTRSDWSDQQVAAPPEWHGLFPNKGIESFTRLSDGRFLALSEGAWGWLNTFDHPGFLYPGDPMRARPQGFTYAAPPHYRPTEVAELPGGHVLVLNRTVDAGVLSFRAKLVLADPAAIRAGAKWSGPTVATLQRPFPVDNMEAMTVEPLPDGRAIVWLMSDDNAALIQQSVLIGLLWSPNG